MAAKPQLPPDPRKTLEFRNQFIPLPGPPGGAGMKPPSMNVSLRLGPKSFGQGGPGQTPEIQQMIMQRLQQLPPPIRSAIVAAMLKGRGQAGQSPPMAPPMGA